MSLADSLQVVFYFLSLLLLIPILGAYMAAVLDGRKHILTTVLGWLERGIYRISGINSSEEMDWRQYLAALMWFNLFGFAVVFLLQLIQKYLPLNPNHLPNVEWTLAFNTAVSFMTNTNWQAYAGETTMSHLTQMVGLAVHNFVSAATGLACFLALTRGLLRKTTSALGNFFVDVTRGTVYILLPLAIILALTLVSQGMIQNFSKDITVHTLAGQTQTIPQGPVASQIAIKQLGSNGGGFFNTNSAHPYENPTPFTNFLEMLAILLIPASLVYSYGILINSRKHALIVLAVMFVILGAGLGLSLYSEYHGAHILGHSLLEGKEQRFGIVNSVLWSVTTTCVSNGSVNAMHSSLSPLSGGVAMFNMMLGEIIFGGVGAGMYGMILFIILTVFLAGLMAGRTPEYLGKKIEKREILMAIIGILMPSIAILAGTSLALSLHAGLSGLSAAGPHGFSEVLYAFTSCAANNGSAFAGLNANTMFYNLMLGFTMLIGRFLVIIPALVIAGSLAAKKITPSTSGTFSTSNMTFAILLLGVIIIVAGLTFFPALALGPIIEHLLFVRHMVLF